MEIYIVRLSKFLDIYRLKLSIEYIFILEPKKEQYMYS